MKQSRDNKGRFVKGCSGNPDKVFTSQNQPQKTGRKPSRFKQIISELNELGEPLSLEDFRKIALLLLSVDKETLAKLANKKDTPAAVSIIASSIAEDIKNKQMGNLDRLMDRVFGRSTQAANINIQAQGSVPVAEWLNKFKE